MTLTNGRTVDAFAEVVRPSQHVVELNHAALRKSVTE